MLRSDPDLQAEFEQHIRKDHEFAGNPRARLQFFYKRSPYWDDHKDVYPIARITTPLRVKTEPYPAKSGD